MSRAAIWANIFEDVPCGGYRPVTGCVEARADFAALAGAVSAADRHTIDSDDIFVPWHCLYPQPAFHRHGKRVADALSGRFVEGQLGAFSQKSG